MRTASPRERSGPALPPSWLVAMLGVKRAPIPVGHTVRSGIAVGLPFVVGALTDEVLNGMWIGLAALLLAAGEREGTYRLNFLIIAVSTPIAAAGFMLGFAQDTPLAVLVPVMALIAAVAGLVAGFGPALSVASMQFLLVASIALGVDVTNWWTPLALYFVGAVWYALLLALQMLIDPFRPQRTALNGLLNSLTSLAVTRADEPHDADARATARIAVTSALSTAVGRVAEFGASRPRPAKSWVLTPRVTDAAERVQAALVSESDVAALTAAAQRLSRLAVETGRGAATPRSSSDSPEASSYLLETVANLEDAMHDVGDPPPSSMKPIVSPLGRETVLAAARLALCFGIAIAAKAYFPFGHWFWVPLTVCLVMKPDFGSVFARALLRVVGTLIGIGVGTLVLLVVSKGVGLGVVIGLLAACVPWFMMRSYALQALAITPIVVLLIDQIQPGDEMLNTGLLRLGATAVGGLVVVVFGYLLWPRTRRVWIGRTFEKATAATAEHLRAAGTAVPDDSVAAAERHERLVAARRDAYRALSELRSRMERQLSEPPPADTVAAYWLAVCSAVERLADGVTTYATTRRADGAVTADPDADVVADAVASLGSADDRSFPAQVGPALAVVADETREVRSLLA